MEKTTYTISVPRSAVKAIEAIVSRGVKKTADVLGDAILEWLAQQPSISEDVPPDPLPRVRRPSGFSPEALHQSVVNQGWYHTPRVRAEQVNAAAVKAVDRFYQNECQRQDQLTTAQKADIRATHPKTGKKLEKALAFADDERRWSRDYLLAAVAKYYQDIIDGRPLPEKVTTLIVAAAPARDPWAPFKKAIEAHRGDKTLASGDKALEPPGYQGETFNLRQYPEAATEKPVAENRVIAEPEKLQCIPNPDRYREQEPQPTQVDTSCIPARNATLMPAHGGPEMDIDEDLPPELTFERSIGVSPVLGAPYGTSPACPADEDPYQRFAEEISVDELQDEPCYGNISDEEPRQTTLDEAIGDALPLPFELITEPAPVSEGTWTSEGTGLGVKLPDETIPEIPKPANSLGRTYRFKPPAK